jgi:MFS family permease
VKLKNLHYAWVIAFAGAAILAVQALSLQIFGIFLIPMTEQFGWERGALSGAYSLSFLLSGVLGIFTGRLSDTYGPRILLTVSGLLMGAALILMSYVDSLWQVYLVWGLLLGVGRGCCVVPLVSTVPRWFEEKRGIAVGIAVAGISLGGMIWPPLAQWLISSYDWPRAFFILGLIIFALIIPLSQLIKQSPERAGVKAYGETAAVIEEQSVALTSDLPVNQVIRDSRFWLLGLLQFCFIFSVQVINVHIAPYAQDIGFSKVVAASFLSVIAGASAFGRLSMGFISDRTGGRLALTVCLIMAILALIWFLFAREAWMFYLFAVVFGLAWGGLVPLTTVVAAELFGLKYLGALMGVMMLIGSAGGSLGAPLAGTIFDITGGYSLAFSICIALCALAIMFSVILLRYKFERSKV